ncbi:MAG: hypothetical protein KAQ65_06775 [Candidatus Thorarchaeota archaeon]|nr:hypothetical protein [Candidatus Thorarchaeota archaeon]
MTFALPKPILIIWILVTLFAPIAIFFWTIAGGMALIGGTVYSLLWVYTIGSTNFDFMGTSLFGIFLPVDPNNIFYGLHILNPLVMQWVPIFGIFNILFAVQIIRYTRGKASLRSSLILGILTLVMPLFQTVIYMPYILNYSYFPYTGPIPIQLALGLIIAKKYGPKPLDAPWAE